MSEINEIFRKFMESGDMANFDKIISSINKHLRELGQSTITWKTASESASSSARNLSKDGNKLNEVFALFSYILGDGTKELNNFTDASTLAEKAVKQLNGLNIKGVTIDNEKLNEYTQSAEKLKELDEKIKLIKSTPFIKTNDNAKSELNKLETERNDTAANLQKLNSETFEAQEKEAAQKLKNAEEYQLLQEDLKKSALAGVTTLSSSITGGISQIAGTFNPILKNTIDAFSGGVSTGKKSYKETLEKMDSPEYDAAIRQKIKNSKSFTFRGADYNNLSKEDKAKYDAEVKKLTAQYKTTTSTIVGFAKGVAEGLAKINTAIANFVAKQAEAAVKMVENAASYDTANSTIFNKTAVTQQLNTGLSSSENYGFSQALTKMGFSSYEDYLNNLPYMNDTQRTLFNERWQKATDEYNKWQESGIFDTINEWQDTYEQFTNDLQLAFIDFFAENKETIQNLMDTVVDCMPSILTALTTILNAITSILSFFSGSSASSSSKTSDILSTYISDSKGNTNNVTVNQTYKNVTSDTIQNKETFKNAATVVYNQVIQAFKS